MFFKTTPFSFLFVVAFFVLWVTTTILLRRVLSLPLEEINSLHTSKLYDVGLSLAIVFVNLLNFNNLLSHKIWM